MLQLPKTVEYALIAMRHMAMQGRGQICTTREIAMQYHIPYELLAKVMQKLAKAGFISSYQGVHGGYTLAKNPNSITILLVIQAIVGKQNISLMQCESISPKSCCVRETCTIKHPLTKLQGNINKMFDQITVMEL